MSPARVLNDAERLDWLRLARTPNIGPVTFSQLIHEFKSAGGALDGLPELTRKSRRGRELIPPDVCDIKHELDRTRKYGAQIVASCEPGYPPLLKALDPPPPVLTKLGHSI
jgi:DNA processing protein